MCSACLNMSLSENLQCMFLLMRGGSLGDSEPCSAIRFIVFWGTLIVCFYDNQLLEMTQDHHWWMMMMISLHAKCDITKHEKQIKRNIQRQFFKLPVIDVFHNGGQMKYSSVLMLLSLSSLATASKFQKNCFKMRAVGLININTKE